jgi:hypothetical protein
MLLSNLNIVNGRVVQDRLIEEYKGYLIETENGYLQAIDRLDHTVVIRTTTNDIAYIKEQIDREILI